jgi:hypothetical protein
MVIDLLCLATGRHRFRGRSLSSIDIIKIVIIIKDLREKPHEDKWAPTLLELSLIFKEGIEAATTTSNHQLIMELEHAHAILRKLGAKGQDGFLREEAFTARELARVPTAAPLVQCECVRVHAGADGLSTARSQPVGPINLVNTYVELLHWMMGHIHSYCFSAPILTILQLQGWLHCSFIL